MEISLQSTLKKKKKQNQNLPDEIIESNILTRLPVKTLTRFMTACKSWYSLFSNPYFVNAHLQIQTKKKSDLLLVNYNHDDLVVIKDNCFQCWSSSFNDAARFPPHEELNLDRFPTYKLPPYKVINVVGCYNGIVCVSCLIFMPDKDSEYHICLWNPALRSSKVVASYMGPESFCLCVGFGYHSPTNDYNVITFSNNNYSLKDVEIYSSNLDSWRKINLGHSNPSIENLAVMWNGESGVYIGCYPRRGAYCWRAFKGDDEDPNFYQEPLLISFDMEDEAFKPMILPYDSINESKDTIFIYKDSLAFLHTYMDYSNRPSRLGNIWVMKDYHDPQSWTKLYSFDFQRNYVSFMGVVENDLIQLACGDQRFWCDPPPVIKEMQVVDIGKSRVKKVTCPKIIPFLTKARSVTSFTESLISLAKLKGVDSKNKSSD